jgi:hypothetical protein
MKTLRVHHPSPGDRLMKTLAIAVVTAVFALTAPVEASAPAPADDVVGGECAPGFSLLNLDGIFPGELYEPYDRNGDGYICWMWVANADRHVFTDNNLR